MRDERERARGRFAVRAVVILAFLGIPLLVAGAFAGGEQPASRPAQAKTPAAAAAKPAPAPHPAEERRRLHLEHTLRQLHRLQRALGGRVGPNREAAGALAAAALASAGGDTATEANRLAASALAACSGRWHKVNCARAQLTLQHLALKFSPALDRKELLPRLRHEVSTAAPPPSDAEIADPWGFGETENQRVVKMARSLVAEVVAEKPKSDVARAWGAYAGAFLRAHARDGWYEADSPGYLPISMHGLLLLADHAPGEAVRRLAAGQLDVLFAAWAQKQVGGYPAGAKTRAYGHWALATGNVPWLGWAWLLTGRGEPRQLNLRDWPELAVARYRVPQRVGWLLAQRRQQPPYEIEERRRISPARRADVDAAIHTWATPDYMVSCSQSVGGMRLDISGGQPIVATLYPEGPEFAPVYLWSRTANPRARKVQQWKGEDFAAGRRNLVIARLGEGHGGGHAYLAAPWGEPGVEGELALARLGDTYLALVTSGGWEVAAARQRFPHYYRDPLYQTARVLVPRRQPASIGVIVGRQAEDGSFEAFHERLKTARLVVEEGGIVFTPGAGATIRFAPGRSLTIGDETLHPERYPLLAGPFLASVEGGGWKFGF